MKLLVGDEGGALGVPAGVKAKQVERPSAKGVESGVKDGARRFDQFWPEALPDERANVFGGHWHRS
jgi:hypothetical protein